MKVEQERWMERTGWSGKLGNELGNSAQLVFVFGSTHVLTRNNMIGDIQKAYPQAKMIGCSTAGEICGTQVSDNSLVLAAIRFDGTEVRGSRVNIKDFSDSFQAGEQLARNLVERDREKLLHVFVVSDGIMVNGSQLVRGMSKHLPREVQITGGLSGDGPHFRSTLVFYNSTPEPGYIAVIGFYGNRLKIGYGSLGGWDPFGPDRLITRSKGNVLYELDGQPALALYKRYLGEYASDLPSTGLLFPLNVRIQDDRHKFVRTILAINEKDQSMTFAGDVPQGSYGQLMKANFDRLVDGAYGAAKSSYETIGSRSPDLAILISCVGRKLVLKQRTEEEVEAVQSVLGRDTLLTGFYSYGEICPAAPDASCALHNQTMTITTFCEK